MRPSLPLLMLVALSPGCGSTYVQRFVLGAPGAPHARPVRTILAGDPVPPSRPVALVQATGRGLNADLPHIIAGLRAEAQRLGCDAVVQVRIARAHSTATATGFAVRWGAAPDAATTPTSAATVAAPWAPPPPLPAATPPASGDGAAPPWSAP